MNYFGKIRTFASLDGLIVGGLWTFGFACMLGNFNYPILGLGFVFSLLFTPFLVIKRGKCCRDKVLNGIINFGQAYFYSLLTLLFSSLLFAIIQWGYFNFLDNGFFLSQYASTFENYKTELMAIYGLSEVEYKSVINLLFSLRPIDFALEFMWINITTSVFLALITAAFIKRSK